MLPPIPVFTFLDLPSDTEDFDRDLADLLNAPLTTTQSEDQFERLWDAVNQIAAATMLTPIGRPYIALLFRMQAAWEHRRRGGADRPGAQSITNGHVLTQRASARLAHPDVYDPPVSTTHVLASRSQGPMRLTVRPAPKHGGQFVYADRKLSHL